MNYTIIATYETIHQAVDLVAIPSQSSLLVVIGFLTAGFATFLGYLAKKPPVNYKSPAFMGDMVPVLGAVGFTLRPWRFWEATSELAKKSTGNFSFWVGKRHLVGLTSSASRKLFYEHPNLDLVSGGMLLPWGAHFWPPVHDIFRAGYARGINNTYFLRRLVDAQTSRHINSCLPQLQKDVVRGLGELVECSKSRCVISPPDLWRIIFDQNNRLLVTEQIVDDAKLRRFVHAQGDTLLHTYSPFNVQLPWLPSPSWARRRLARYRLESLGVQLIQQRQQHGTSERYGDRDVLQSLVDRGDRRDWIIEYFTSAIFIASTNAGVIASQVLNITAMYPEWQERVFAEVQAVAGAHSLDKTVPLVERLNAVPLEGWESGFPVMYRVLKECMRMWVSFNASRFNTSSDPIFIPGSDEVIPGNTFVIYNTTQCNFNPDLYPNPTKFDPDRYMEGRKEFEKEQYGYLGWGQGKHPCAGKRWGKLQQTLDLAYVLAMYKLKSCDKDGNIDVQSMHRKELDSRDPFVLPPSYVKLEPREKV